MTARFHPKSGDARLLFSCAGRSADPQSRRTLDGFKVIAQESPITSSREKMADPIHGKNLFEREGAK
jgi:hypothetical protein